MKPSGRAGEPGPQEPDAPRPAPARAPATPAPLHAAPEGTAAGTLAVADVAALQRSAGNAAVSRMLAARQEPAPGGVLALSPARLARQTPATADPAATETMPDPLRVTWAKDPFEVSLTPLRGLGDDRLEITLRYTGPHATQGPFVKGNTQRLTVAIAPKPLAPKMSAGEGTSVDIDLYGDGRKRVRLKSTPSFDSRPTSRGRQHGLSAIVEGRSVFAVSLWVLDPKASETDIPAAVPEEHPGERPEFRTTIGQTTGEMSAEIDGDGDQRKELVVKLLAVENYDEPKGAVSKVKVSLVQKSTGQERFATFDVPRQAMGGSLAPIVSDVTDGKTPTRISLVLPFDTRFLDVWPGTMTDKETKYVLSVGGRAINYVFPADPRGQAKVGERVAAHMAGAIVAFDIRLGAHNDEFRVTISDRGGGKGSFGITALNEGSPTGGGMGADITLNKRVSAGIVDTGATSVGIDLDGDDKADLQLFDRLTGPPQSDGTPPERRREHRIRLTGPALGGDRTFDFYYRNGFLTGGLANPGPADIEADRNAKAVTVMEAQGRQGSVLEQITLQETAMVPRREKAVAAGVLDPKLFAAWKDLSADMTQLEIAVMKRTAVDPALRARAAVRAMALEKTMNDLTTWNKSSAVHMATRSENTYTGTVRTNFGMLIETPGLGFAAARALTTGNWVQALDSYGRLVRGLDRWVADKYEWSKAGRPEDRQEARYMSQRGDQLASIAGKPGVFQVPAVFHPDKKFKDESGYVNAIPLSMYCWREGDTWKLKDITNPAKPYTYSADADSKQAGPPAELFAELDDPDHYTAGVIQTSVPDHGMAFRVNVRDRLTWKKFFSYLGLGLAAVGISLATFGTGTVAVVGAWALTASAVSGAVAAGIDLAEHIKHDNLDSRTAVLNLAQIVGGLAGAGALAGGRLAASAAGAPAAGRFAGAWAHTAAAAQRFSVPLTAVAAGADLVQIGLVAHDTARQLDEIENNPHMSFEEKARAKMLLLSQVAVMGGLGALTVKGTVQGFGRGRQLVVTPGPEGLPVASTTLVKESVIIDSNAAIALRKRAAGEPLQAGEEALLKKLDAMGGELRIADKTVTEAAAKGHAPPPQQGIGISAARNSPEYQAIKNELDAVKVGGDKGAADREIVADAFFAMGEKGVIPRFATMDEKVYKRLYDIRIKTTNEPPLNKLGKQLPAQFPDGFDVTINGRTITVIPLPKK